MYIWYGENGQLLSLQEATQCGHFDEYMLSASWLKGGVRLDIAALLNELLVCCSLHSL
jgi:hypothetical protein